MERNSSEVLIMSRPLQAKSGLGFIANITAQTSATLDSNSAPPGVEHAFIFAFGCIWEYGPDGTATKMHFDLSSASRRLSEQTSKTHDQFNAWFQSPSIREQFSPQNYNKYTWNCIEFVKHACEFLNVSFPSQFQEILDWCRDHVDDPTRAYVATGTNVAMIGGPLTSIVSFLVMTTGNITVPLVFIGWTVFGVGFLVKVCENVF